MEDQSMKSGSVRSKLQGSASFHQWKELSHLSDDAIPCPPDLSKRAAQMLIGKPNGFIRHISSLIKKAEVVAPWSEFYHEVFGIEFDCFDFNFPQGNANFNRLLVMQQMGPVGRSIEAAQKVGYKVHVGVDLGGPASHTRMGLGWHDYALWTMVPESGISAAQLYEQSIPFTDLSETLLLMAQRYFETGHHWGANYYTICSVTGRHVTPKLLPDTYVVGAMIPLQTPEDNAHPTINIVPVEIHNNSHMVQAVRVLG